MPLPLILGIGAAIAGAAGIGGGIHGAVKMKDANDTMKLAKEKHEEHMKQFDRESNITNKDMDRLGTYELEILKSFSDFSDVFERIKNRPVFEEYSKDNIRLPKYDGEKLKEVSVGAGVLLGGLGGAALGVAGGYASVGAAAAAIVAFGTASTGTAIGTLSGAAATNAALALLGGGSLAAGGGGIALGTTILGATTLGVGLLVGGIIFSVTGSKLSDKADEAWAQMRKAEKQINEICQYMKKLRSTANRYYTTLSSVNQIYQKHLSDLKHIVIEQGRDDWSYFTGEERLLTENAVLLVGLLYQMCKVELVIKGKGDHDMNQINTSAVETSISNAETIMRDRF